MGGLVEPKDRAIDQERALAKGRYASSSFDSTRSFIERTRLMLWMGGLQRVPAPWCTMGQALVFCCKCGTQTAFRGARARRLLRASRCYRRLVTAAKAGSKSCMRWSQTAIYGQAGPRRLRLRLFPHSDDPKRQCAAARLSLMMTD